MPGLPNLQDSEEPKMSQAHVSMDTNPAHAKPKGKRPLSLKQQTSEALGEPAATNRKYEKLEMGDIISLSKKAQVQLIE